MSHQQSSDFFQELITTPHTEYFTPINLTFIQLFLLQHSCNKLKMPPLWSMLQWQTALKRKRLETQIRNTCLFCWCNLQTTIQVISSGLIECAGCARVCKMGALIFNLRALWGPHF